MVSQGRIHIEEGQTIKFGAYFFLFDKESKTYFLREVRRIERCNDQIEIFQISYRWYKILNKMRKFWFRVEDLWMEMIELWS